jgi:hypothetical protein
MLQEIRACFILEAVAGPVFTPGAGDEATYEKKRDAEKNVYGIVVSHVIFSPQILLSVRIFPSALF